MKPFFVGTLLSLQAFAGTLVIEGQKAPHFSVEKVTAQFKSSNCPYFCVQDLVARNFVTRQDGFRAQLPISFQRRLGLDRITLHASIQTQTGLESHRVLLDPTLKATGDFVIDSFTVTCRTKLFLNAYAGTSHTQQAWLTCSGPRFPLSKTGTTTIKDFSMVMGEEDLYDGEALIHETFDKGYTITAFDNGTLEVGARSKLILDHKFGSTAIFPKGEYRIQSTITSFDKKLLLASIRIGDKTAMYSEDPFHPHLTGSYGDLQTQLKKMCPQVQKVWYMDNGLKGNKRKFSLSCK